jgi:hypothetical protein
MSKPQQPIDYTTADGVRALVAAHADALMRCQCPNDCGPLTDKDTHLVCPKCLAAHEKPVGYHKKV